jgi:hypothetical protein
MHVTRCKKERFTNALQNKRADARDTIDTNRNSLNDHRSLRTLERTQNKIVNFQSVKLIVSF